MDDIIDPQCPICRQKVLKFIKIYNSILNYNCAICFKEPYIDMEVGTLDPCGHSYCLKCAKNIFLSIAIPKYLPPLPTPLLTPLSSPKMYTRNQNNIILNIPIFPKIQSIINSIPPIVYRSIRNSTPLPSPRIISDIIYVKAPPVKAPPTKAPPVKAPPTKAPPVKAPPVKAAPLIRLAVSHPITYYNIYN
jgi:hypothetical protein